MARTPKWRIRIYLSEFLRDPDRVVKRAMKKALKEGARHWHQTYARLHYQSAAYYRYRGEGTGLYKQRHSYTWYDPEQQKEVRRDREPLHETGWAETQALSSVEDVSGDKWAGISGTSTKARVKFTLPQYIKALDQKTKYKAWKEVVAVNKREINALARVIDRSLERQLNLRKGRLTGEMKPI